MESEGLHHLAVTSTRPPRSPKEVAVPWGRGIEFRNEFTEEEDVRGREAGGERALYKIPI